MLNNKNYAIMRTKVSFTPWKKNRFPRKMKKKLVNKGSYKYSKRLLKIANFGRMIAYNTYKNYYINIRHVKTT